MHPLPVVSGEAAAGGGDSKDTDTADTQENLVFTRQSFQYINENKVQLSIPHSLLGTAVRKGSVGNNNDKNGSEQEKELYFCKDLYYVTKVTCMENINSRDMNMLMHRLANHKNIFKTRQLLKKTDDEDSIKALQEKLYGYIEELRLCTIKYSKFQSAFCTSDLLQLFVEYECFDQVYCVEEKKG
jgi:hypothetical protein